MQDDVDSNVDTEDKLTAMNQDQQESLLKNKKCDSIIVSDQSTNELNNQNTMNKKDSIASEHQAVNKIYKGD
jgi:hypothetical protein